MAPIAHCTFWTFSTRQSPCVRVVWAIIKCVIHGKNSLKSTIKIKWSNLTRPFSLSIVLFYGLHLLHTVPAYYVDDLGCSAAITAFGANIFAGTAGLFDLGSCSSAALWESPQHIQQRNALNHLQVLPALLLDEVQQFDAGAGDGPTVFRVMLHFQPVRLGH